MIGIGDTVDWRTWYRCEVLDIRDGLLVIQPFCNAKVTVRPSDVRLVKRAGASKMASKMKKITEEYWMVWTLNNWDGLVYYHGQDGELKRNDFVGAHRFKTYEAAERVAKALEKKDWPAGFDNVQITHAWTVGRFDRHHEDVYRGRLNAAYAA